MTKTPVLHVPLVTPLTPGGTLDLPSLARLAQDMLSEGAAGVVLFGTLGEAQSFSVAERKAGLDALLSAGIDPEQIMVGIGAAALPDTIELSRHALGSGCARQLLLPPFFFKGVSDEGLFRFIAATVEGADDPRLRLMLYDIPGLVSVAISQDVIARLTDRLGPVITGLKDSVPDWAHVESSIRTFPHLDVFVGNEIFLPRAIKLGGAGAISGLGNIAPRQMSALVASKGDDAHLFSAVCTLYDCIARHPVVPTVKALTARSREDATMAAVRAPLDMVNLDQMPEVTAAADALLAIGS
ncbi:dihydrodipicolinate synthase family protein [Roseicitreum antarcticum]|uniref:4-hydroxy-tetrahydrodipicolinate synthase n=1 Tax=Roseicitreum antarcticum TaxID=564137 RepID=A0A1H2YJW0_9RHOB|nr:dihydrodipicolinate synthase family protein [Roseicitreum antarcticum]SDX05271.1 4-hydroxy-tetrahydrodipicolinate synthase [Roseicitreum antarcticum]